ncbi:MAG TPA: FAD-dependent monooxygenase [Croceibacterium sp.]
MRSQVCIIGAGPAGHLLGHLLRAEGSNARCSSGRRPTTCSGASARGLLEQFIVSLMKRLGLDARLKAEGLPHDGFNLADGERLIRVDVAALTGKHVMSMARPA